MTQSSSEPCTQQEVRTDTLSGHTLWLTDPRMAEPAEAVGTDTQIEYYWKLLVILFKNKITLIAGEPRVV